MAEVIDRPDTAINLPNMASEDSLALTATNNTTEVAAPAEKKVKKIIRRKKRPARAQVDPATVKSEPPAQTGTTFNIWYNKWAGGDKEDSAMSQTHAKGRCNIALDSGYTKADGHPGAFFCLYFARGVCHKGQDCDYLHRLPGPYDIFPQNVDCFGRDKFSDYRDDMGGVGSFSRQNRTIYVGRIHVSDDIEEIVARHFAEWGPIERIRVLSNRGIAFVTYRDLANAEFAKEAMAWQSLEGNEILNLRWSLPDPNPMAQKREARRIEEQAAEAIRKALPADFVAEIEGKDPEARKRRKIESGYGLEGYEAPDEVHFARGPNAVNPRGREGFELEHEQRLMLEAAEQEMLQEQQYDQQQPPQQHQEGGIFSNSTLAALQGAQVAVASKPAPKASAGPLVAYDSDSD
ncbi:hypothetical protein QBC36DRAFT_321586 [Triangularia setosa]|uniref:Pre-mRNA-splicing factor CWC2 n=1 Tax=Triangularia setosa TaxID=2587417 RepID=A0AAN6WDG4_9PEZI|nr:hypothetical protein QBC36DRAFT_321586 [Podospora setosa]